MKDERRTKKGGDKKKREREREKRRWCRLDDW